MDTVHEDLQLEDAAGEKTISARSGSYSSPVKFFGSWDSIFVQRAWIALEEKHVDYQWIEISLYNDSASDDQYRRRSIMELKELHPDFIMASSEGDLPALDNAGVRVAGPYKLLEYIDQSFPGPELFPTSSVLQTLQRYWIVFISVKIQAAHNDMVQERPGAIRESKRRVFLEHCRVFSDAMSLEGPYFLGDSFSMVDIAFAPFWQRFIWVSSQFAGLIFPEDPAFLRLHTWWDAVSNRPSVSSTLVSRERLIQSYRKTYTKKLHKIRSASVTCHPHFPTSSHSPSLLSGIRVLKLGMVVGVAVFIAVKLTRK